MNFSLRRWLNRSLLSLDMRVSSVGPPDPTATTGVEVGMASSTQLPGAAFPIDRWKITGEWEEQTMIDVMVCSFARFITCRLSADRITNSIEAGINRGSLRLW